MRKEKPKNEDLARRPFRKGLLIGLLVGAALMIVFVELLRSSTVMGPPLQETLIVPFRNSAATLTHYTYSGYVTLSIQGTGQAAGNDYSDAFYLYTENGFPLNPPVTHQFDLEIDGNRAIITLGLESKPPTYNPKHFYTVYYDVGAEPRLIAFRISDMIIGDNSGQFLITVSRGSAVQGG